MPYSHKLDMNENRQSKYTSEIIHLVNTLHDRVTQYFLVICFQLYVYVSANSHFDPTLRPET